MMMMMVVVVATITAMFEFHSFLKYRYRSSCEMYWADYLLVDSILKIRLELYENKAAIVDWTLLWNN